MVSRKQETLTVTCYLHACVTQGLVYTLGECGNHREEFKTRTVSAPSQGSLRSQATPCATLSRRAGLVEGRGLKSNSGPAT